MSLVDRTQTLLRAGSDFAFGLSCAQFQMGDDQKQSNELESLITQRSICRNSV